MRNITTVLLFSLAIFTSLSYSQKVDLDKAQIDVSYIIYPKRPLAPEYLTYSVAYDISSTTEKQLGISAASLKGQCCRIEGYKDVGNGGHFMVRIKIGDLYVSSPTEQSNTTKEKDKDGKEISKTTFRFQFRYKVPTSITIIDHKQVIVGQYPEMLVGGSEGKTPEFSSLAQLKEYWSKNATGLLVPLWRELLNENLRFVHSTLIQNYAYYNISGERQILWVVDSKKHPEYEAFKQHASSIQTAFKAMKPNIPLNKADLQASIDYFEALPSKYLADEKSDRKIRYSAYFNLSKIYFWLEDFNNATKNADLLIKNDYDKNDGEEMLRSINIITASLESNKLPNRHIARDLSKATPPPLTDWQQVAQSGIPVATLDADDMRYGENNAQLGGKNSVKTEEEKAANKAYELQNTLDKIGNLFEKIEEREEKKKDKIKVFDAQIAKDSLNASLYYERGLLKKSVSTYDKNYWTGAIADLERAAQMKPKEVDYQFEYALILGASGNYTDAIKGYDKVISLKPKYFKAHQNKAIVLQSARRYAESIEAANLAFQIDNKNFDVVMNRGFCYYYIDKFEEARKDFEMAATLNLKSGYPYVAQGYLKNAQGKFEEALPFFAKAEEIEPSQARLYANRAFALANLGKLNEAKIEVEKSLTFDARYGNAYFVRGWIKLQEGNNGLALEDAKKSIEFRFAELHKPLTVVAEAYMGMRKYEEATQVIDNALAYKPNFVPAQKVKEALLKLTK